MEAQDCISSLPYSSITHEITYFSFSLLCFSVLPDAVSYTMLYNLLTFPAGVVPVSTVTAEDEEELRHYKGVYQDYWDRLFKQVSETKLIKCRGWKT